MNKLIEQSGSDAGSTKRVQLAPHVLVACVLLFPFLIPPFARSSIAQLLFSLSSAIPLFIAIFYIASSCRLPNPRVLAIPSVFFFSLFALTLFSLLVDYHRVVTSDFYELLKPVAFFLVFSLAFLARWDQERLRSYLIFPLAFLLTLSAVLAAIEYLPGTLATAISEIYVRPRGSLQNKSVAVFATPYFAGSVYLFVALVFLGLYLSIGRLFFLVFFTLGVALAVSTQSRTVFLTIVVGLPLYLTLYLAFFNAVKLDRFKPRRVGMVVLSLFGFSLALAVAFVFLRDHLSYLVTGVNYYLLNLPEHLSKDSGSVGLRMSQIRFAIENNPYIVTGAGIGRSYSPSLESFIALYYFRYGLLGITVYILMWGGGIFVAWRCMRYAQYMGHLYWAGFLFGVVFFILLLPILSLSSVITDQVRLYPIYYTMLGVVFAYYNDAVVPGLSGDVPCE